MFYKMPTCKKILRALVLRVFNFMKNNGNPNFDKNGEKVFISNLFRCFANESDRKRAVFDVGGNIGKYSEMLLKVSNEKKVNIEIHIFEPTEACFF